MKEVSVKIRISYQDPEELEQIMNLLRPVVRSYKAPERQQGAFRKAYVETVEPVPGRGCPETYQTKRSESEARGFPENEAVRKPGRSWKTSGQSSGNVVQ